MLTNQRRVRGHVTTQYINDVGTGTRAFRGLEADREGSAGISIKAFVATQTTRVVLHTLVREEIRLAAARTGRSDKGLRLLDTIAATI